MKPLVSCKGTDVATAQAEVVALGIMFDNNQVTAPRDVARRMIACFGGIAGLAVGLPC